MNVRCLFHVSPAASNAEPPPARKSMPSIDVELEGFQDARPRGSSIETWMRARGWASED